jgi:hypothetical protein
MEEKAYRHVKGSLTVPSIFPKMRAQAPADEPTERIFDGQATQLVNPSEERKRAKYAWFIGITAYILVNMLVDCGNKGDEQ